jgi:hypothetical protein
MAISYIATTITAAAGGTVGTSTSFSTDANTRALLFFIYADASNTAANNTNPSEVSWNGINATLVAKVADSVSPLGQMQFIYKIDNPGIGTAQARANHATQFHHHSVFRISAALPVTINASTINFNTGTAPSSSITAASGCTVLHSVVADGRNLADITINGGSTLAWSDGSSSRQAAKISAIASSGGGTESESWTLTASSRWSAASVTIVEGVIAVDTINGSSSNPSIDVSGTNTATTSGLGTITSISMSDGTRALSAIPSMPSGDGSFAFTWPYADAVIAPLFGSVTTTFGDGANAAAIVGTTAIPSGYASVTFVGATDISSSHLGHVLTLTDGKRMYYPTTNGAVINADGSLAFTTLPYTLNAMLHNVHSGGDNTITSVTIDITGIGEVVASNGGITLSGLTTIGLTRAGLTSAGL